MPTASGHTTAIRASAVIGADVYDTSGQKLGKVEEIILDKTINRTMFVIVSAGGAVTTSDNYYPLPWSMLDYDKEKGGYVVPLTKVQLADGPADSISHLIENGGVAPRDAAYSHYKVEKDW